MTRYRSALPQLGGDLFLTDGGIETTLVFHEGLELPHFAAFHLLETQEGRAALRAYFRTYAELARRFGAGLVLESPTWRANPDWGTRLGYAADALAEANRDAVRLLEDVRDEYGADGAPIVISGCVGPRGDGYVPDRAMSAPEAEAYHRPQIEALAGAAADMVCAITMNHAEEAAGVAGAARQADMPVAISFTVETDGNLPTGQTLGAAIEQVDARTSGYPAYYMINCAHPTHFEAALRAEAPWVERVRGLRANASRMSHAELDEAPELDTGDPVELGREYAELKRRLHGLSVLGGCCGTDHRHVEQIAAACRPLFRDAP
ncbi:MAG: homocysteine S-methyltransferase family protein [Deltaproteobacteria bacterium]|nr:MAG: homocysteine S-methyltransferase family protein [Deltaproteobacteria bacterium]